MLAFIFVMMSLVGYYTTFSFILDYFDTQTSGIVVGIISILTFLFTGILVILGETRKRRY